MFNQVRNDGILLNIGYDFRPRYSSGLGMAKNVGAGAAWSRAFFSPFLARSKIVIENRSQYIIFRHFLIDKTLVLDQIKIDSFFWKIPPNQPLTNIQCHH